ncbi:hypothetical protein EYF80_020009 [Liparis tanakae]|uniref:Uncharacterized protein n=1 Tax=Liparis tanakae TaxID=230148 RepID=A0A4Z2HVP9_9TELE|nr:hypothetical protein EYF80_020009 [Liparis tanakae]
MWLTEDEEDLERRGKEVQKKSKLEMMRKMTSSPDAMPMGISSRAETNKLCPKAECENCNIWQEPEDGGDAEQEEQQKSTEGGHYCHGDRAVISLLHHLCN